MQYILLKCLFSDLILYVYFKYLYYVSTEVSDTNMIRTCIYRCTKNISAFTEYFHNTVNHMNIINTSIV